MNALERKKRILIVDDDEDMQIYFSTLLHSNGFHPIIAQNESKGLQAAQSKNPHLIILDMMMHGEVAIQLYRRFKCHKQLNHIPVMMISAIDPNTFFHYHKIKQFHPGQEVPGPEAYMTRPPEAEDFIRLVHQLTSPEESKRRGNKKSKGR